MPFTTWSALHQKMLDDLSSGRWHLEAYSNATGQMVKYRSFEEFQKALDYVAARAAEEQHPAVGRTHAQPGSGGRW